MVIYDESMLKKYMENDWIADLIQSTESKHGGVNLRTNQWLKTMENKRMIYADVYGDFLKQNDATSKLSVLDIGGGLNSLTKLIAANTNYTLVDYMAHGGEDAALFEAENYHYSFVDGDWYTAELKNDTYDVIIANDIFPDVDMRLELFLDRFLPRCKELRLIVTWYNDPKFYVTKRVDDTESLTFLSWDGEIISLKLKKYITKMMDTSNDELEKMKDCKDTIYRNGRQVAYIRFKGIIN